MKKVSLIFLLTMLTMFGVQFFQGDGSLRAVSAKAGVESLDPPVQALKGHRVLHSVSYGGREFLNAFNAASDRTRLVLVFSPTCSHCLQGASEVAQILSQFPNERIKVLVLWSPLLGRDSSFAAQDATAYLTDPRAQHFWDLWTFGVNHYTQKFKYPEDRQAWDIFVLYGSGPDWRSSGAAPEPSFWMQNHHLDIGPKYTQALLKSELEKLLR